jgi:hypothetical protein
VPATPFASRFVLDLASWSDILELVSAQTVGIILGIFSGIAAAVIYWGGFAEEKRASAMDQARISKL